LAIFTNPLPDRVYESTLKVKRVDFIFPGSIIIGGNASIPAAPRGGIRAVRQREALHLFYRANCVLTCPGLTTLLELSRGSIPTSLLPPQNYSQLLILNELHSAQVNPNGDILSFLLGTYGTNTTFDREQDGVEYVRAVNKQLTDNEEFRNEYVRRLFREIPSAKSLSIARSFDGAAQCAETLLSDFGAVTG
jgi:hypothetical protein